jgi:hypothetical protein
MGKASLPLNGGDWDLTLCSAVDTYQRFAGTLKVGAAGLPETLIPFYQTTRRHILSLVTAQLSCTYKTKDKTVSNILHFLTADNDQ